MWAWLAAAGIAAAFSAIVTAAEHRFGRRAYSWLCAGLGVLTAVLATAARLREDAATHPSRDLGGLVDWLAHVAIFGIALLLPAGVILGVSWLQRGRDLPGAGRWVVGAFAGALAVVPGFSLALWTTIIIFESGP